MRIIGIAQTTHEYAQVPAKLERGEFLWIACGKTEIETNLPVIQETLARLGNRPLIDLHIQDLLSTQQSSHYDFTSSYDVIIFRHPVSCAMPDIVSNSALTDTGFASLIATEPIGLIIYDQVLLTVHDDLENCNQFATKLLNNQSTAIGRLRRTGTHLPVSPDELMLHLVDFLTEGHLDLRRNLSRQLEAWQTALLSGKTSGTNWQALFEARNTLHQLEDLYEDQSSAIKAWQESIEEEDVDSRTELLAVRARDVIGHIDRSCSHIHRLQSALEGAIQLHFSATANRTNQVMRTLTVLTAIFLPLNLLAGIFGMNFAGMFLTEYAWGFWLILCLMVINVIFMVRYFWRKNYLNG